MKNVLFFLIACCIAASAAHANPPPLGGNGSIVVGSDNLTRILVAGPAVYTYNGSAPVNGAAPLLVAGPTIPAPSTLRLKLAMGGGLELGMFATDTWKYCQWYLNSANAEEGSSPIQTASYTQLGYGPDSINGSPTFYGFADDSRGNGLFGIEWPLAPGMYGNGFVGGGAFDSTSGGAAYAYSLQGASIGLDDSSNGGLLDGVFNNLDFTYVKSFVFNENLINPTKPVSPIGSLWLPVAVTSTVNRHVQVVWEVTSSSGLSNYIDVSDWNPSTNVNTMGPAIYIEGSQYSAASACSYGGDGLVRVLINYDEENWYLLTINPLTGADTFASIYTVG